MPSVFLSPSTQQWNRYVNGGNEEQQMNLIADAMEPYLRSSGITYSRNDPDRDVRGAIADSNSRYYDVHLALHSNAGGGRFAGILSGIDIYYSPYSAQSERLADIIVNNLKNIYPNPSKVNTLPTTSLGEVTQTRAVAVLCELGYHDNPEDAEWIKSNTQSIARNLVQALCDYFGIPFVEAVPARTGTVTTDGSNLNIRSLPNTNARVVGVIPNRAEVTVLGQTGNWYVVSYGGMTGYAAADYISV
ncbi:MAG: N-acetylmuramoyl-L-alanine amidase [Oscillospiraceae bacterium]|nr:N-acetylmuramoyl-L-alanine amidase [Oscillospiraceae bacterium]